MVFDNTACLKIPFVYFRHGNIKEFTYMKIVYQIFPEGVVTIQRRLPRGVTILNLWNKH